jgi:hypothetical protein
MIDKKLHRFFLSCKIGGIVETNWIEGLNLRHAKEKLEMKFSEATDILDWTNEKPEELEAYLEKERKKMSVSPNKIERPSAT